MDIIAFFLMFAFGFIAGAAVISWINYRIDKRP